jgi:hypothetical protein
VWSSALAQREAMQNGASAEEVASLGSHVEIHALQAGVFNEAPLWILEGGQPLYGTGTFEVVPKS